MLAFSITNAFAAGGDVEHNTQAFLDVLNAGTGKPMEQRGEFYIEDVVAGNSTTITAAGGGGYCGVESLHDDFLVSVCAVCPYSNATRGNVDVRLHVTV